MFYKIRERSFTRFSRETRRCSNESRILGYRTRPSVNFSHVEIARVFYEWFTSLTTWSLAGNRFAREVERKDVSSTIAFKVPRCTRAVTRKVLRSLDVLLDKIVCFLWRKDWERECVCLCARARACVCVCVRERESEWENASRREKKGGMSRWKR